MSCRRNAFGLPINMDLLEKIRQWVVCVAIILLIVYVKPFPVVMVLGALLGVVYIVAAWREIRWKDWWPFLLIEVFYLIAVLNIRGALDPNMHFNTNWVVLQVGFALIPFIFIGLRPQRRWGTVWVLSSIGILTLAFIVATIRSFQEVDGALRFVPYHLDYYSRDDVTVWTALRSGISFYSYGSFARGVLAWPMYMSYCFVVGMLVVLHRLFNERKRIWLRLTSSAYFLLGIFLCNARMMYLCLVVLGGLLFCRMLVKKSYRPVPLSVVVMVLVGVSSVFFWGSRGSFFNPKESDGGGINKIKAYFNAMVDKDHRMHLWIRTWKERDAFLPWGLGSGESGTFIKEHYYDKYGDVYGNKYEGLVVRKDTTIVKMHNMCLDTVVEQGYWGLMYLLCLLFIPFTRLRRLRFVHVLLYVSLLVLISFESIVYSDFAIYYFCMVYCAVIAFSTTEIGENVGGVYQLSDTTEATAVRGKAKTRRR